MKIRNILPYFAITLGVFSQGCDNEIDLLSEYREIGVIYGILNYADSVHVVRIQKAFLGKGDANQMAQVSDSIYYPDILDVRLIREQNGQQVETIPMTRFNGDDKEEGTFASSPNILYHTNGEQIYSDSDYKILVTNTETGYQFYATTPVVDSLKIYNPTPGQLVNWSQNDFTMRYSLSPEAYLYNLTIRFHYGEEVIGTGTVVPKYIDWVFANDLYSSPQGSTTVEKDLSGEDFCRFVADKLNPEPNTVRYAGNLDFILVGGGKVLANFIRINQSSSTLLTSAPSYTNVENGLGIFSSRYISSRNSVQLHPSSIVQLKTNPYTADLGFQ